MQSKETFLLGFETPELRRCSRCKSNILLSFLEKNRQGECNQLCRNCCAKKPEGKWVDSLTEFGRENIDKLNENAINRCRKAFIQSFENRGCKYVGKLSQEEANYPEECGPEPKGDEVVIEYHLFKNRKHNLIFNGRWRLRIDDCLKS